MESPSLHTQTNASARVRSWTRFSLRGLLVLTTALCLFLGWRSYYERKLQRIERRLGELQVEYRLVRGEVPRWRSLLLGRAVDTRIDRVGLRDLHFSHEEPALIEIIDLLVSWGGVRELEIFEARPFRRADHEQFARLRSLERISFDYCEPGDAHTIEPLASLPRLREISTRITYGATVPTPYDFYLSLPNLKVLGLPGWSEERGRYLRSKRPDLELVWTDLAP